jgi:hypothetical protein
MNLNKSNVEAIILTEKGEVINCDLGLIGFAVQSMTKGKIYIVEYWHEVRASFS